MSQVLRIGFSACLFHPDPDRPLFKGKTLLYLEESMAHWVFSEKTLGFLIPTVHPNSQISLKEIIEDLDALVLQGGADVAPSNYGESPLKPEWNGDIIRDKYEIALIQETLGQGKPILGICRGVQILNVALGGSLYQDIPSQIPQSRCHRNWENYDKWFHEVEFTKGEFLHGLTGVEKAKVNSIHHQCIKTVANDLVVEAKCVEDGVIEAVRLKGQNFVMGIQWHPEFHDTKDDSIMDCGALLKEFLRAARERKVKG